MRREMLVGAVLLLVGCGAGYEQPAIGQSGAAETGSDPCLAVTDGDLKAVVPQQKMTCVACGDPGGDPVGDPSYSVPTGSTYVRNLGARTYSLHHAGVVAYTTTLKLKNSTGSVIGHVSLGATTHWLAMHVKPSSGEDVRIRTGLYRDAAGQWQVWNAVKFGTQPWTRPMVESDSTYFWNHLSASRQNLVRAGMQAAADSAPKQDVPKQNPVTQTCTEGIWALGIAGIYGCPNWLPCGMGVGILLDCHFRELMNETIPAPYGWCYDDQGNPYPCPPPPPQEPPEDSEPNWHTLIDSGDPLPSTVEGDGGGPSAGAGTGGYCF
jgi:hypothetical protein